MIFIYRILNVILPKSSRIIVFSSSNGKSTGGNPRAIFEYAVSEIYGRSRNNGAEVKFCGNRENAGGRTHGGSEEMNTEKSHTYRKYRFVWFLTDELMRTRPEEAGKLENYADSIWAEPSETVNLKGSEGAILSPGMKKVPKSCKVVRYGHPAYYWYMARAGAWVFDSRQEPYIRKRPGVRYLQTWHGTPLKKLGLDIDEMNMAGESGIIEDYRDSFRREASQWNYLIAQNSFSAETFRRCFDFHGEMLKIGYPRNDVLVRAAREKAKAADAVPGLGDHAAQIYLNTDNASGSFGSGGISGINCDNRKTLLYAPTWRDDKYIGGGWYAYSSPLDFEKLYEILGNEFRIVIKPHYLVKIRPGDIPEEPVKNGFVSICGQGDEINDLYLAADGLITDYSSAMFDYSLLGRPMFFFAYDMKEYADRLRGFYFDFEDEAPGPICGTTKELGDLIKEAFEHDDRQERYREKILKFSEKYNTYDNGDAAKKAWEAVLKG